MSQTLSAIARGSPLNDSDSTVAETQEFTPSSSAIAVNALWFLSLGLSVAVSLIAILAKEWCHSFMAGRFGSILRQARLRQQRWDGIERWKMKEILYVLPLIMHTALLLFAVGLSLYLWNINIRVALPVVITTSLAVLFYVVTVSLPLFFRFCPYTTALARFLYPYWLALLGNRHTMDTVGTLIASLGWMSHSWVRMKHLINHRASSTAQDPLRDDDIEATMDSQPSISLFSFRDKMQDVHGPIQRWVESMRAMFSTDRSQLVEKDTPMDSVASSIIAWMIVNCEDSRSVDMALQALAGAEHTLPRLALWECGAVDLLCQRINDSISAFPAIPSTGLQLAQDTSLDDASLYSRSLCLLTAFIAGEGLDMIDPSEPHFVVKDNYELVAKLQSTALRVRGYCCYLLDIILNHAWNQPIPRYDLVAYELNAVPTNASMGVWIAMEDSRNQCQKQQELVQHMISGKLTNLPSSAISALISGITKTYIYNPRQSPKLLIGLLRSLESVENPHPDCRIILGVGLALAALFAGNYCSEDTGEDESQRDASRLNLARDAYVKFRETGGSVQGSTLSCFGLLSLLGHNTEGKWTFDSSEVALIGNNLDACWSKQPYHDLLQSTSGFFDCGRHLVQILSGLINTISYDIEPNDNSGCPSPALLRIEAALGRAACYIDGGRIVPLLTKHFTSTGCVQLKRLCLRAIKYSLEYSPDQLDTVLDSLVRTSLLTEILAITSSTHNDLEVMPYCMEFLWGVAQVMMYQTHKGSSGSRRSVARSLLQSLDNRFKTSSNNDGLPKDRDETGLANLWLPKIGEIAHNDPQVVLDSNLLSAMIEFYDYDEYSDRKPRTTELPSEFDNTWTWLEILRYWKKRCEEAVERKAEKMALLNKKPESIPAICGLGSYEGEEGTSMDYYDWSI